MYPRWRAVFLVLALAGCHTNVAFRSTHGGATSKPGVPKGTTNSVYLGDMGGVMTRTGLTLIAMVMSLGSLDPHTTVTKYDDGTTITTTRTTTYTVNEAGRRQTQDFLDKSQDPQKNFAGFGGGLEIAARTFGGDTSGWMYSMGYEGAGMWNNDFGWRASTKLGFGRYTFHDRMVRHFQNLAVTEQKEDATYSYFGAPVRAGITYRGILEVFAQLDLNLVTLALDGFDDDNPSPSLWRAGARVTFVKYFYVEGMAAISALRSENTSIGVEVGLAF